MSATMLTRTALRSSTLPRLLPAISVQSRPTSSTPNSSSASASASAASNEVLNAQRLRRPIAPHISIYKPQVTSIGSSLNRITGVSLSGAVYVFGISYALAPAFGWHLESATLAASFAGLPLAVKAFVKLTLAAPFTYHAFNGVRHLVWDTGRALDIKSVYTTAYAVFGLTAVGTGYLAFFV